jgi:DNA-binding MarR family transcriptional regulator
VGSVDLLLAVSVAAGAGGGALGWLGHVLWGRRSTSRTVPVGTAAMTPERPTSSVQPMTMNRPSDSSLEGIPAQAPISPLQAPPIVWSPPERAAQASTGEASAGIGLAARVILHLARLGRLGPDDLAKVGSTQQGIAAALQVSQGSLVRVLQRLVAGEMVSVERRHVARISRRLKVYTLTGRGESAARDLRHRRIDTLRPRPQDTWAAGGVPKDRSGTEKDRLGA